MTDKITQFFTLLSVEERTVFDQLLLGSSLREKYAQAAGLTLPEKNTPNLPTTAPALWAERTTGRVVSPADFILTHYGEWLGKGLTRAHIGQLDKLLYDAYAVRIGRHPDEAIATLPSEPRVYIKDPVEALERRRARDRAYTARSRARNRGLDNL